MLTASHSSKTTYSLTQHKKKTKRREEELTTHFVASISIVISEVRTYVVLKTIAEQPVKKKTNEGIYKSKLNV
jgi:hypothetical protein